MKGIFALLAFSGVWVPHFSFAAPMRVVDQELGTSADFGYVLDYPGDYIAQTFTVRNSGRLAEIGVQVSIGSNSFFPEVTADLLVRLIGVDAAGYPTLDRIYGAYTFEKELVPRSLPADEYLLIDVIPWNLQVRAGDAFAIAVSSDHAYYTHQDYQYYVWHSRTHNPVSGGEFYIYSPILFGPTPHLVRDSFPRPMDTRDMGFRVVVEVPEPQAIASAIVSMVSLLAIAPSARHRRPDMNRRAEAELGTARISSNQDSGGQIH